MVAGGSPGTEGGKEEGGESGEEGGEEILVHLHLFFNIGTLFLSKNLGSKIVHSNNDINGVYSDDDVVIEII